MMYTALLLLTAASLGLSAGPCSCCNTIYLSPAWLAHISGSYGYMTVEPPPTAFVGPLINFNDNRQKFRIGSHVCSSVQYVSVKSWTGTGYCLADDGIGSVTDLQPCGEVQQICDATDHRLFTSSGIPPVLKLRSTSGDYVADGSPGINELTMGSSTRWVMFPYMYQSSRSQQTQIFAFGRSGRTALSVVIKTTARRGSKLQTGPTRSQKAGRRIEPNFEILSFRLYTRFLFSGPDLEVSKAIVLKRKDSDDFVSFEFDAELGEIDLPSFFNKCNRRNHQQGCGRCRRGQCVRYRSVKLTSFEGRLGLGRDGFANLTRDFREMTFPDERFWEVVEGNRTVRLRSVLDPTKYLAILQTRARYRLILTELEWGVPGIVSFDFNISLPTELPQSRIDLPALPCDGRSFTRQLSSQLNQLFTCLSPNNSTDSITPQTVAHSRLNVDT